MFKFNRLVVTVLLVGVAAVSWGAVTKIPSLVVNNDYLACDGVTPVGLNINSNADGMAILNYAAGAEKTIVQVIVSDFTGAPFDRFIVKLGTADLGTFLVDSQGNGHFHGEIGGDHSGSNVELWQQIQLQPCPAVLIATGQ